MGVLEWLGAHLLGPLITAYRAFNARPRPDIRIVELKATGGSSDRVDFSAYLQNRGTQVARVAVRATVGERGVAVSPAVVDLLVNALPVRVAIVVPRPGLGELMHECGDATTLYGKELLVEAAEGKHRARATWREVRYDPDADRARHEVQQRYLRRSRGEETESDLRAEWLAGSLERLEKRQRRHRSDEL